MAVATSAFHQHRLVCQLCLLLQQKVLAMVMHVIVTSKHDYCNMLYVVLPLEPVWKLQNVSVHMLTGANTFCHGPPILQQIP